MKLFFLIVNICLHGNSFEYYIGDDTFMEKEDANKFLKGDDTDILEFFQDDLNVPEVYSSSEKFYARDVFKYFLTFFREAEPWNFKLKSLRKLTDMSGKSSKDKQTF
jgi:hypothetical protein